MNKYDASASVDKSFVYTSDVGGERWRIMKPTADGKLEGDCEDYALTVLYYVADKSLLKFWFYLITFQAVIWHCKTINGTHHAQLWFRGRWIDNIGATWSKTHRHKLWFPYIFPLVAYRMLTSKLPPFVANVGLVAICSIPLVLEYI